ncbi:MAG: DsbA family oxidoreductase [Alphaproteobacteria bacterium]|nr:DsbA family oxidoreductase [Alphaproteobacteria bacterium]
MNILVPKRSHLVIEIVHDLVCPWCFVGVRRLLRTLQRRHDLTYELIWRPFLLNPDMPRAGISRMEYVVRKFGGEERARRLNASISEIGKAEGIAFRFDLIRRTPSSVDAHRLVSFAGRHGLATEVIEAVFAGHFSAGLDTGETDVLVELAAGCGLDPRAVRQYLLSDTDTDGIHAENLRAHRLGINGVPCFIIGGQHAIAGAQESEVIERLLDVATVAPYL